MTREQAAAARMVELSQAREGVEAEAAAAEKEKAKLAAERAELEAREKSIARKVRWAGGGGGGLRTGMGVRADYGGL